MSEIALWKEGILAIILLLAIAEMIGRNEKLWKIDWIDALIIALIILGFAVSIPNTQYSILNIIYGAKYDFIPLIAFLILRRVPWSEVFLKRVINILLASGLIIAAYGIVSFFLFASFFTRLGYSDLHSLYLPDGPLAPFQQIGGTSIRRIQSVMSGPNQLGLWLLIPVSILFAKIQETRYKMQISSKMTISKALKSCFFDLTHCLYFVSYILLFTALLLTFSRAAWIGAAVIAGIALWPTIRSFSRRKKTLLVAGCSLIVAVAVLLFPSIILRAASSRGHIENPLKAVQMMIAHPLGLGLGTAGPASNRTSDACVMLEAGSDASWASDRPDLCVFVDNAQVQPADRTCRCPFLPENWYLQIGVEMGWLGLCLYLALVVVVLRKLWIMKNEKLRMKNNGIIHYALFIFLSLSIASLFLHAWEDSAVAYTTWMILAVTFGQILAIHPMNDRGVRKD